LRSRRSSTRGLIARRSLLDTQRQSPASGDEKLGAKTTSGCCAEPDVAFKILALNTEGTQREGESLETSGGARAGGAEAGRKRLRLRFEQAPYLTLGAATTSGEA